MYNYHDEMEIYEETFSNRYYAPETHGQNAVTYVSKYSYIVNAIMFLVNFTIFMFYFQLSMMGVLSSGFLIQFPLILQFVVLFFYLNKHINLHIRTRAMD